VILGILLAAIALFALYGLWAFWPASPPPTGAAPPTAKFSYFNWQLSLTRDQQFFVIVALAGVIGAMLHGLRSLSRYIGERYLFRSWIPYYILLPLVGAILATIVYVVLRPGSCPGRRPPASRTRTASAPSRLWWGCSPRKPLRS